jgi:hypothetical protein
VFLSFAFQPKKGGSIAGACFSDKAPGDVRDDGEVEAILAGNAGQKE